MLFFGLAQGTIFFQNFYNVICIKFEEARKQDLSQTYIIIRI